MTEKVLFRALLLAGAALLAASVIAQTCPAQPPIAAGNRDADALFRQRALNPSSAAGAAASRPANFVEAAKFDAKGDGKTDDTAALQRALNETKKVWLGSKLVYRITRRLSLPASAELASDGSATILLAAGADGFSNAVARRNESGIYGEKGVGLRTDGAEIAIRDLFIVKEFEDERYVVGIDVRASEGVRITRVRMRGFSLAPGIITIRSSSDVEVSESLIHGACTATSQVPEDVPSLQITGISVDDTRVEGRGSTRVVLRDNVIADLRMIPRTPRGVQTDGIHFAAIGTGAGSIVRDNYVAGVDEAVDIYGSGIEVSGNRLHATAVVVKLIHGARSVNVRRNQITPVGSALGVGLFRAAEEARQVRDIVIEGNHFRIAESKRPGTGIGADIEGPFAPRGIVVRDNIFDVSQCDQKVLSCSEKQCTVSSNRRRRLADQKECD